MIKKLFTNSAIYGIAPHVPKIVSVFILPLLTTRLTDVDYGIAGTIAAYTMALAAFSTLGFNVVLQVSFYKSRCQYKILWREIYGFLQNWMVFFAVLQGVVLYFVIPKEAIENRWLIILLTNFNGVFFGPSALLGLVYYQLKEKPLPIAIRSVTSGLLTVFANYIFIVVYDWGYMGWYVSSFVGTFVINASYCNTLNRKLGLSPIYRFKRRTIKNSLKVALPTIPHYYSMFLLNTSNRVVMDRFNMNISLIGEFNMAQQFASMMDSCVNAVNMAVNPMTMNAIRNNDEEEARRIIYTFGLVALSSTFLFSLWSKEIFAILIKNETLAQTYPYAAILIMALNYRPMYIAASNMFFYYEKTIKLLYITFAAGVMSLLANIILIPLYGLWAAVLINYISFLYMGYSGFLTNFFRQKSKASYPCFSIMLLQIGMTILCFCLLEEYWKIKIIVSVLYILIVSIVFFKVIKK